MTWLAVFLVLTTLGIPPFNAFTIPRRSPLRTISLKSSQQVVEEEVDVVVVGSGLAGLSCAALLASRGLTVTMLEAHYELGGCAHDWAVGMDGKPIPSDRLKALADKGEKLPPVFQFEAGPSLYSGLSPPNSPNPLKSVFQMIEEEPEWITVMSYNMRYNPSEHSKAHRKVDGYHQARNSPRTPGWKKMSTHTHTLAKQIYTHLAQHQQSKQHPHSTTFGGLTFLRCRRATR